MPIRIAQTPEPMSERSLTLGPDSEAILADSDATLVLREDLRRYCHGQVRGRSFLIAGHRGAGKTTLVNNAILEVWRESERGLMPLRPLFVPLHGPNLFPPMPAAGKGKRVPGPVLATAAGEAEKPAKSEAQIALEQITLGLHRAAAREFVQRFWARVEQDEATESRALSELAAQFETELYESPTPARLREFWARAAGLEEGVLARRFVSVAQAQAQRPQQAMRELAALSGVVEAYRRISGDYKRTEKSGEKRARSIALEARSEAGKELTKPLAALATGVLAGAGALSAAASPLAVVGSGIVAALGSAAVFKLSSNRSSTREQSREDSFIFDLSVATLDRVLPTLVDRLRDAGLAPVFVVDELDKVDGLSTRIIAMVHHLKKLVAENAFFCFLTDRGYFEDLRLAGNQRAYDVAYSYFSHRLMVAFGPDELDLYLTRLFAPTATEAAAALNPNAAPAEAQRLAEDNADREVLPWMLRQRAALHPLTLQRELSAIRDGDAVRLRPGEVRSRMSFRIDVTLQVAIEFTLAQPTVQQWLAQRPEMRQTLFDALYYPTRAWRREDAELDLSPCGRTAFLDDLSRRMNLRDARASDPNAPIRGISDADVDFLYAWVGWLGTFLARDRLTAAQDWRTQRLMEWANPPAGSAPGATPARTLPVAHTVIDALLLGRETSLLVPHPDRENLYLWRYWCSGDARPGAQGMEPWRPEQAVETTFLAGVEYTLAQDYAAAIGARDPLRRVILREALLYPLRLWREEKPGLEINSIGQAQFLIDMRQRQAEFEAACGRTLPAIDEELARDLFAFTRHLASLLASEDEEPPPDGVSANRQVFLRWAQPATLSEQDRRAGRGPLADDVLANVLIGTERAVLVPTPGQPERYRFRYRRDGKPLVPEARTLEATKPASVESESLWKQDAAYIRALDEHYCALLDIRRTPAGVGLAFTLFAEQLRILPTTPAWSFVAHALARLEQSAQSDQAPATQDMEAVRAFRLMLETSAPSVAHSLVCASFLAGAKSRSDSKLGRLDAVLALSRGLRCAEHSTSEIAALVGSLGARITELFGAGEPNILENLSTVSDPDTHRESLEAACAHAASLAPKVESEDWPKIIDAAWRECRSRLLAYMQRSVSETLEVHELLCLATRTGPASLLVPELESMPINQWSDALYAALTAAPTPDSPPRWLCVFALRALGYVSYDIERNERLIDAIATDGEQRERIANLIREDVIWGGQATPPSVLLVRRAQGPYSESWLPDRNVLCLAFTQPQLEGLIQQQGIAGRFLSLLPEPRCVVWEQPGDSARREEELTDALKGLWGGADARFVEYSLHAERPRKPPRSTPIIAPRGPVDLSLLSGLA